MSGQGVFSSSSGIPEPQIPRECLGKVQRMSILEVTTLKKDLFLHYTLLGSSVEYGSFWDVLRL